MNKYHWTVQSVPGQDLESFAVRLDQALNAVEQLGFEVDDIMDAPGGRHEGVVVIGKKPMDISGRRPA